MFEGPPEAECVLRGAGSCSDRAAWPPARVPGMGAALRLPQPRGRVSQSEEPPNGRYSFFHYASEHLAPSMLLWPGRGWGEASDVKFKGENLVINNITISIQYFFIQN